MVENVGVVISDTISNWNHIPQASHLREVTDLAKFLLSNIEKSPSDRGIFPVHLVEVAQKLSDEVPFVLCKTRAEKDGEPRLDVL